MEKSKKFSIPISRRDFMKLAAISAAAIAAVLRGISANDARWEDIPQDKRRYVSKG